MARMTGYASASHRWATVPWLKRAGVAPPATGPTGKMPANAPVCSASAGSGHGVAAVGCAVRAKRWASAAYRDGSSHWCCSATPLHVWGAPNQGWISKTGCIRGAARRHPRKRHSQGPVVERVPPGVCCRHSLRAARGCKPILARVDNLQRQARILALLGSPKVVGTAFRGSPMAI